VDLPALIERQRTAKTSYQAYAGERMATQIRFDNEASDARTLIEIETEDRLGLLYTISQTFAQLRLDISAARIVTERGAAIDSFYVSEADGSKLASALRREHVAEQLRAAMGRL
jgi:[protein-PII] uridylyltransferase